MLVFDQGNPSTNLLYQHIVNLRSRVSLYLRPPCRAQTTLRDFAPYVALRRRARTRSNAKQNDLELGATEAVQQHFQRHVVSVKPVSQRKLDFEHARPRWMREMLAEATGVFFYGKVITLLSFVLPRLTELKSSPVSPLRPVSFSTRPTQHSAVSYRLASPLPLALHCKYSLLMTIFSIANSSPSAIITCGPTSGG